MEINEKNSIQPKNNNEIFNDATTNNTTKTEYSSGYEPQYAPRSRRIQKETKPKFNIFKFIRNIVIVIILLLLALFVLDKAPNYKNRDITDKTNLIINNNNITAYLKKDLLIENNIIYVSKQDIANFFDPYIYYDEKDNRIVITYDTKVTNMILNSTLITINDVEQTISATALKKDDTIYIPFSELSESFNMDLKYNSDTDIVTVDTLSREQTKAIAGKNVSVKSIKDTFSRTVAKIKKNEEVILINDEKDEEANINDDNNKENEWSKIRTSNGVIGYVKNDNLTNVNVVRDAITVKPQIEGTINLVWDNFYVEAPDRAGTTIEGINVVSPSFFVLEKENMGEIQERVGAAGIDYVKWAHSNNYKVWAIVSNIRNESMIDTTSKILNSYELRNKTINNIINLATKYNLDGINIDFEYMYKADKDMFTQFIVELYPRLKEKNIVLSVDVTAPDGGENWSMCFDRHDIANNCDYIVFMAYDQYSEGSTKAGTTAGLNWIKIGLNKFLKTEEIDPNQIILGLPFYTRLWTENSDGKATSNVVDMKNITRAIPDSAYENKVWNEDLGQYYVEYTESGKTKKMWIEDERSLVEKLKLVTENDLAGVAFWAKDRESSNIWSVIKETLFLD